MKFIKTLLLTGLILASGSWVQAQRFLPKSTTFSHKKVSYITLADGSQIQGNIKDLDRKKGLIEEVKIKTLEGKVRKIKPEDISHMYLPQSGWDKMTNALDFATDAQNWDNADVDRDVVGKGYAYFEQSEVMIKKKKRTLLLMLINPAFSKKVKVYLDPFAKESMGAGIGGVTLVGGDTKSYYIKKGNAPAYLLKRKDYDMQFKALFEDCPSLINMHKDNLKWNELDLHVYTYNWECS